MVRLSWVSGVVLTVSITFPGIPVKLPFAMSTGAPAAQEMRPIERTISEAFKAGSLEGLHAALVILRGEILAEIYFEGVNESWGKDLGVVVHGPDTLHDIRSITKSVTGLLSVSRLPKARFPRPTRHSWRSFPNMPTLPTIHFGAVSRSLMP